jgi:hypothetical protein
MHTHTVEQSAGTETYDVQRLPEKLEQRLEVVSQNQSDLVEQVDDMSTHVCTCTEDIDTSRKLFL